MIRKIYIDKKQMDYIEELYYLSKTNRNILRYICKEIDSDNKQDLSKLQLKRLQDIEMELEVAKRIVLENNVDDTSNLKPLNFIFDECYIEVEDSND